MSLTIRFLGAGDAFGSGGRFQTCFLGETEDTRFLIDCGATSLVAIKRAGIDPCAIETIFLTHLHGDHFGGLPFFLLDARFSKRKAPIAIVGPRSSEARIMAVLELFYPGATSVPLGFPVTFHALNDNQPLTVNGITVTGHLVEHPSGAHAFAIQIEAGGKKIGYSGDTSWCGGIVRAAAGCDLFIAEAYGWGRSRRHHLDHATLAANAGELTARRILVTQMDDGVLAHLSDSPFEAADDGRVVNVL